MPTLWPLPATWSPPPPPPSCRVSVISTVSVRHGIPSRTEERGARVTNEISRLTSADVWLFPVKKIYMKAGPFFLSCESEGSDPPFPRDMAFMICRWTRTWYSPVKKGWSTRWRWFEVRGSREKISCSTQSLKFPSNPSRMCLTPCTVDPTIWSGGLGSRSREYYLTKSKDE